MSSDLSREPTPAEETARDEEEAVRVIQKIVEDFNGGMGLWRQFGCVANFVWLYEGEKKLLGLNAVGKMELAGVDKILFRREAPSDKVLEEVMEQARAAAKELSLDFRISPDTGASVSVAVAEPELGAVRVFADVLSPDDALALGDWLKAWAVQMGARG